MYIVGRYAIPMYNFSLKIYSAWHYLKVFFRGKKKKKLNIVESKVFLLTTLELKWNNVSYKYSIFIDLIFYHWISELTTIYNIPALVDGIISMYYTRLLTIQWHS